jgi:carbamoyl-phosphate synthase large subunit
MGVLEKFGVEMIGAKREAIEMAEDRKLFREAMDRIGLENPKATIVSAPKLGTGKYDIKAGLAQAMEALEEIGLPAIIRPAFTLGGTGGGVAYNREEYEHYCRTGMEASPVAQILVDESLLGWKEFEMEVVRDKADNAIIVCSIENVDPMGVHTGDSITVAPALTLTDKEYQMMRNGSIAVLREIGVETGGSNVQWAVNPEDGRMVVIEMNPRVSRSKRAGVQGHGLPDRQDRGEAGRGLHAGRARQRHHQGDAGLLRADHRLRGHEDPALRLREVPGLRAHADHRDEIGGRGHGHRPHLPRVDAEGAGSMETGLTGFDEIDIPGAPEAAAITKALSRQTPDRVRIIAQAMRHGLSDDAIAAVTRFDPWFLARIREIVETEDRVRRDGPAGDRGRLRALKMMGFTDARLAKLTGRRGINIRRARLNLGVTAQFKRIDTCAAEFEAQTPYMYSTYEHPTMGEPECEARPTKREEGRHPRRRPQPHRPGDRVRLLLLPRLFRAVGRGLRDHHGQLQPRDRVDRLRHLRPPLFRAADLRTRDGDPAGRAGERHAARRHRAVRRPDPAEARQRAA